MGTVATTDVATATAYGNQRKIDRTANGVLWELYSTSGGLLRAQYSTDGGTTWSSGGVVANAGAVNYTVNGSLKIDEDDYAHVAYKNATSGYIEYLRGTPNAARTAYTWSAAVAVYNSGTSMDHPDIVAFRDPAVSGAWRGTVVMTQPQNTTEKCHARTFSVSAAGAVTFDSLTQVGASMAAANANSGFPSIDFNHTGDGKTVAGGTPHLYVAWSAGTTGSGYGLRFRKANYSAGSWTWGTEREIDNTRIPGGGGWLQCFFDGTRVVIAGFGYSTTFDGGYIYDRDAADTATTTANRVVLGASNSPAATDYLYYGGATYDTQGNVYLFGADNSGANGTRKLNSRRWVRSTQTLDPVVTFDATGPTNPYVTARRGPQGQAIDYVYTDGTTSPYEVKSGRIVLNQNPTAATPLTPADNATIDSSTDQTVTFRHNDPDGDAASSWRIRYRPAGTSIAYAYLTGSSTAANGATISATVPANTWPGQIEYASQTYDPSGAEGAWSVTRTVTGVPAALAALTGGQGGTSLHVPSLVNLVQSERALRALSLV